MVLGAASSSPSSAAAVAARRRRHHRAPRPERSSAATAAGSTASPAPAAPSTPRAHRRRRIQPSLPAVVSHADPAFESQLLPAEVSGHRPADVQPDATAECSTPVARTARRSTRSLRRSARPRRTAASPTALDPTGALGGGIMAFKVSGRRSGAALLAGIVSVEQSDLGTGATAHAGHRRWQERDGRVRRHGRQRYRVALRDAATSCSSSTRTTRHSRRPSSRRFRSHGTASRPSRSMALIHGQRRRLLAVAIVGLVAVLLFGLLLVRPWDRSTPTPQPTAGRRSPAGIDGDSVPLETALQAFAYLTGVDVPGVRVPAGAAATTRRRRPRARFAGSDRPLERAHAGSANGRRGVHSTGDGRPRHPRHRSDGEALADADRVASIGAGAPPDLCRRPWRHSRRQDRRIADAVHDDLFATIAHIGPKLGLPAIREGLLPQGRDTDARRGRTGRTEPTLLADAAGAQRMINYSPCNLTLYKNMWSKEAAGQPLSRPDARDADPRGHPLLPVPGRSMTSTSPI